jgi:soluble lytic murein transglycosylase-like protein
MKFASLAAALALLFVSPAFAQVAAPATAAKKAFLDEIESRRSMYLPRLTPPYKLTVRFEPRLDEIKADVLRAQSDSDLAAPRKKFAAWDKELLGDKFDAAKAEGLSVGSRAQYFDEQSQLAKFSAALHTAMVRQETQRSLVQNQERFMTAAVQNPAYFFDGARSGAGAPAAAPSAVTEPPAVDLKDASRYAKVREILISQGKNRRIVDMAIQEAIRQNADPLMVLSVINSESGFDSTATSYRRDKKGDFILDANGKKIPIAHGLMQLTADKGSNLYDIPTNLRLGVAYLKQMFAHMDTSMAALVSGGSPSGTAVRKAVAAYNAGPGAVDQYHGVPPYAETQGYVKNVLGYYASLQRYMKA